MDYIVRKSARAKRMRLSIDAAGALTLVLPRFVPELAGRVFVESQKEWIKTQRLKMKPKIEHYQAQEILSGSVVTLFDKKYGLVKIEKTSLKKDRYFDFGKNLVLQISSSNNDPVQPRAKALLEKFYKDKAGEYLTEQSEYWATKLRVSFGDVRIKSTKTRWGSCSSKGNLNYNWRIMQAPEKVINYLVIHEVCHLKEMNHSAKFWTLVESLDPDFKVHQKYLKDNQDRLLGFLQD